MHSREPRNRLLNRAQYAINEVRVGGVALHGAYLYLVCNALLYVGHHAPRQDRIGVVEYTYVVDLLRHAYRIPSCHTRVAAW